MNDGGKFCANKIDSKPPVQIGIGWFSKTNTTVLIDPLFLAPLDAMISKKSAGVKMLHLSRSAGWSLLYSNNVATRCSVHHRQRFHTELQ